MILDRCISDVHWVTKGRCCLSNWSPTKFQELQKVPTMHGTTLPSMLTSQPARLTCPQGQVHDKRLTWVHVKPYWECRRRLQNAAAWGGQRQTQFLKRRGRWWESGGCVWWFGFSIHQSFRGYLQYVSSASLKFDLIIFFKLLTLNLGKVYIYRSPPQNKSQHRQP